MDENGAEREITVTVKRQWDDHRRATFRIDDLEGLRWDRISGGVQAVTPQPFVHAYVWCNDMIKGELTHSGAHGPCPHRIKVCLIMADNRDLWSEVLRRAGPRPTQTKNPILEKRKLFQGRGLSRATINALLAAGIDTPERLLFMDFKKVKLKGIGPTRLQEIEAYRTRYLPKPPEEKR
jgi:hypothetical protein